MMPSLSMNFKESNESIMEYIYHRFQTYLGDYLFPNCMRTFLPATVEYYSVTSMKNVNRVTRAN